MKPQYKYIVFAILCAILAISLYECGRRVAPEPIDIVHSPSATPANKWLRNSLPAIVDTTEHYKRESTANKPKVAKNKKVLHNTLSQIIVDTSKVDSLYQFAKDADKQMKTDSAIQSNQERQIDNLKKTDSTNTVIKDSTNTDNKKVAYAAKTQATKEEKKAKSTGRYQGVIITVGLAILAKIVLSLIN